MSIQGIRKNLLNKIKNNDLMTEKYSKTCKYLNYAEHLLILSSTITGCVSISAFDSLVCVPVRNKNLYNRCRNQKVEINYKE